MLIEYRYKLPLLLILFFCSSLGVCSEKNDTYFFYEEAKGYVSKNLKSLDLLEKYVSEVWLGDVYFKYFEGNLYYKFPAEDGFKRIYEGELKQQIIDVINGIGNVYLFSKLEGRMFAPGSASEIMEGKGLILEIVKEIEEAAVQVQKCNAEVYLQSEKGICVLPLDGGWMAQYIWVTFED